MHTEQKKSLFDFDTVQTKEELYKAYYLYLLDKYDYKVSAVAAHLKVNDMAIYITLKKAGVSLKKEKRKAKEAA